MRNSIFVFVLAAAPFSFLLAQVPNAEIARPPEVPSVLAMLIETSQPNDGTEYSPTSIHIIVRNVSDHVVLIDKITPVLHFSAFIVNAQGRRVSFSREAKQRLLPQTNSVIVGSSSGPGPLRPRDEAGYTWNLGSTFDLSAPGKYRIRLTGDFEAVHQPTSSNTIELTVRKPGGE